MPELCHVDFTELAGRMDNPKDEVDLAVMSIAERIQVGLSLFQKRANPLPDDQINFNDTLETDLSHLPKATQERIDQHRANLKNEFGSRPDNYRFVDDTTFQLDVHGHDGKSFMPLHDSCDSLDGSEQDSEEAELPGFLHRVQQFLQKIVRRDSFQVIDTEQPPVVDDIARYNRWREHMRAYFRSKGLENEIIQDRIFTILMQGAGGVIHTLSTLAATFLRDCTEEMVTVHESQETRLSLQKEEDGSFSLTCRTPINLFNNRSCKFDLIVGAVEVKMAIPLLADCDATIKQFSFAATDLGFSAKLNEGLKKDPGQFSANLVEAPLSDAHLAREHSTPNSSLQTTAYGYREYRMSLLVASAAVISVAAFSLMLVSIFNPALIPLTAPTLYALKVAMISIFTIAAAIPMGAAVTKLINKTDAMDEVAEVKSAPAPKPAPSLFWKIMPKYKKVERQRSPSPEPNALRLTPVSKTVEAAADNSYQPPQAMIR